MDLWSTYKNKALGNFAASRMLLNTGDRKHTSLHMIESKMKDLQESQAMELEYREDHRYLVAKDINFDLLFTAYDINTRYLFAARATKEPLRNELAKMFLMIRKTVRNPSLEFRFIGLQNNYKIPIRFIDSVHRGFPGRLAEIDLFGTDTRHIAIDTKTGMPYDILLQNRIYRPGELTCQNTADAFKTRLNKLTFI